MALADHFWEPVVKCRSATVWMARTAGHVGLVDVEIYDSKNQEMVYKALPLAPANGILNFGRIDVGPVPQGAGFLSSIHLVYGGPHVAKITWADCLD
jgi:hypothetical protein